MAGSCCYCSDTKLPFFCIFLGLLNLLWGIRCLFVVMTIIYTSHSEISFWYCELCSVHLLVYPFWWTHTMNGKRKEKHRIILFHWTIIAFLLILFRCICKNCFYFSHGRFLGLNKKKIVSNLYPNIFPSVFNNHQFIGPVISSTVFESFPANHFAAVNNRSTLQQYDILHSLCIWIPS